MIKAKKILLTIITFMCLCKVSFSQVNQEWTARYNGTLDSTDTPTGMVVDRNGNVYVTGQTRSVSTRNDFVTIKYSSSGVQQWIKKYNGTANGDDRPLDIQLDNSNNVIVTGYAEMTGALIDAVTIKYDENGNQLWTKQFDSGNSFDYSAGVDVDSMNNVYIGVSSSPATGNERVTIKYDASGTHQWIRRTPGTLNGAYSNYIKTYNNNVIVCGIVYESNFTSNISTLCYDSNGNLRWEAVFNGSTSNDFPDGMAIDNAGNFYITGESWDVSNARFDIVTIKYGPNGVQQWVRRIENGQETSIAIDHNGNILVAGNIHDSLSGGNDISIFKYDSNGNLIWESSLGTPGQQQVFQINTDTYGNAYIAGVKQNDYLMSKLNTNGNVLWKMFYDGPVNGYDYAEFIEIDSANNVIVTGVSTGIGMQLDFLTIKYSQPNAITKNSDEVPDGFVLFQNFPNPFNPETKIKFEIPANVKDQTSNVRLKIYNSLGKEVKTLVNENLQPGSYETTFDGRNLTSGVYFYELETENFSEVKRMMLVK